MADFFYIAGRSDGPDEIIDRLASRYGWTYAEICALDLRTLDELDRKAATEIQRDHLRAQWTAMLPYMSLEMLKFISFEDYYNQATGGDLDMRPAAEILAEAQEIRRRLGVS